MRPQLSGWYGAQIAPAQPSVCNAPAPQGRGVVVSWARASGEERSTLRRDEGAARSAVVVELVLDARVDVGAGEAQVAADLSE